MLSEYPVPIEQIFLSFFLSTNRLFERQIVWNNKALKTQFLFKVDTDSPP